MSFLFFHYSRVNANNFDNFLLYGHTKNAKLAAFNLTPSDILIIFPLLLNTWNFATAVQYIYDFNGIAYGHMNVKFV